MAGKDGAGTRRHVPDILLADAAGGVTVSGTVQLRPGAWLSLDGDPVEVVALSGATVTVRDAAGKWQAIGMAALLERAFPLEVSEAARCRRGRPRDGLHLALDRAYCV